jgi:hypothetical protein
VLLSYPSRFFKSSRGEAFFLLEIAKKKQIHPAYTNISRTDKQAWELERAKIYRLFAAVCQCLLLFAGICWLETVGQDPEYLCRPRFYSTLFEIRQSG